MLWCVFRNISGFSGFLKFFSKIVQSHFSVVLKRILEKAFSNKSVWATLSLSSALWKYRFIWDMHSTPNVIRIFYIALKWTKHFLSNFGRFLNIQVFCLCCRISWIKRMIFIRTIRTYAFYQKPTDILYIMMFDHGSELYKFLLVYMKESKWWHLSSL